MPEESKTAAKTLLGWRKSCVTVKPTRRGSAAKTSKAPDLAFWGPRAQHLNAKAREYRQNLFISSIVLVVSRKRLWLQARALELMKIRGEKRRRAWRLFNGLCFNWTKETAVALKKLRVVRPQTSKPSSFSDENEKVDSFRRKFLRRCFISWHNCAPKTFSTQPSLMDKVQGFAQRLRAEEIVTVTPPVSKPRPLSYFDRRQQERKLRLNALRHEGQQKKLQVVEQARCEEERQAAELKMEKKIREETRRALEEKERVDKEALAKENARLTLMATQHYHKFLVRKFFCWSTQRQNFSAEMHQRLVTLRNGLTLRKLVHFTVTCKENSARKVAAVRLHLSSHKTLKVFRSLKFWAESQAASNTLLLAAFYRKRDFHLWRRFVCMRHVQSFDAAQCLKQTCDLRLKSSCLRSLASFRKAAVSEKARENAVAAKQEELREKMSQWLQEIRGGAPTFASKAFNSSHN